MTSRFDAITDALVVAGLVAVTSGIFLILADYVLLSAAVRMLESRSLLPPGWGAGHAGTKQLAAAALAVPAAAFVGWRMYRTARRSDPDA